MTLALALIALKMLLETLALFGVVAFVGYGFVLLFLGNHWKHRLAGFLLLWCDATLAMYAGTPQGRALLQLVLSATP